LPSDRRRRLDALLQKAREGGWSVDPAIVHSWADGAGRGLNLDKVAANVEARRRFDERVVEAVGPAPPRFCKCSFRDSCMFLTAMFLTEWFPCFFVLQEGFSLCFSL
jgi:hypothetical protein